jgi:TRAP-type uncharacterized transport system substrate-binding protein
VDNVETMMTSVEGLSSGQRVAVCGQSIRRGGLIAALALAFAPLPAFSESAPAGMVPYDHPVFHNGHRVLWHGVWRGGSAKKGDDAEAAPQAAKSAPAAAAKADAQKPSEFSILVDSDDACANRLAGELAAALQAGGVKGRLIAGRTSPSALAKAVQNDAADLAIAPMDALIGGDQTTADWRERGPFIARLGAETIEIVAPRAIADVRALAGRDVGFGAADSAGAATAATLFAHLGVAAKPSFASLDAELADLASGKLAAVVAVGAKSSKPLADFGKDGGFHVLSIPWTPALQALYAPARLTAKDRPNLVGGEAKIDTLAAPRALIALDAAPSSARADQVAGLTKSFFEGFDKLLGPDNDATWRDVNLAAGAPWPRLRAAQAWIDLNASAPNASLEAFRVAAKTAALTNGGPGAQDSDRLYDSLMQWRSEGR